MNRLLTLNPLADIAVVLLLAIGNFAFGPSDPGLLAWQPTPWVILPVWIGLRRGIAAGIISASALFVLTMIGHTGLTLDLDGWGHFLRRQRGLLYWTVVFGAVCGEVRSRWDRVRTQQARDAEALNARLRFARAATRQLREEGDEMSKTVGADHSGMASLDEDLRSLSGVSARELPRLLLLLAQRHGRVSEAAFYSCELQAESAFPSLRRRTFIGRESQFPLVIESGFSELVDTVLESRKLVSLPELQPSVESKNGHSPYVIAAPLCTSRGEVTAVLLVSVLANPSSKQRLLDTLALIASRGGCLLSRRFAPGKAERARSSVEQAHAGNA